MENSELTIEMSDGDNRIASHFPNIKYIPTDDGCYFEAQPGDGTAYKFSIHPVPTSVNSIVGSDMYGMYLVVLHNLTNMAYSLRLDKIDLGVEPNWAYIREKFRLNEYTARMLSKIIFEAYKLMKGVTK